MAYMSQEKKAVIAAELKKVIPAGWKWSLGALGNKPYKGKLLETFKKIKAALNIGNWDKSDVMTDYFDVGHYVDLHIGQWDKPFRVIGTPQPGDSEYERLKAKVAELQGGAA